MKHLVAYNRSLLHQLYNVIEQLDTEQYQKQLPIYSGSSIGQHTRHILCFFDCLLNSVDKGELSYDKRTREIDIETNIAVCLQKTEAICSQLIALDRDVSLQLHTALGEETICTTSSVSRELIYVIEHTVHHMAILKMGAIINFPSVKFPENFGFAQSTIDYQSTCAQ